MKLHACKTNKLKNPQIIHIEEIVKIRPIVVYWIYDIVILRLGRLALKKRVTRSFATTANYYIEFILSWQFLIFFVGDHPSFPVQTDVKPKQASPYTGHKTARAKKFITRTLVMKYWPNTIISYTCCKNLFFFFYLV